MRILHTSDWHVGKVLKGVSRIEEHRRVLAEIVEIARARAVDLVLISGDLFESAAPVPDAQALVWRTLLNLRDAGAEVVAVAGNHDNPHQFEALRPVFAEIGIRLLGHACSPDAGGLLELSLRSGDRARVGLLPFCSQRYVIKAAQLMNQDAAAHAGDYAQRLRVMIEGLCHSFAPDAVNIIVGHCMVHGGKLGGGEREAQSIFDYGIPALAFPSTAHYVALGHLHRAQSMPHGAPVWYSGSPIHVDFGEENDDKVVLVIEATPATPARVERVPLGSVRRLRTVHGTLPELRAIAGQTGDDLLRVIVDEPARAGLADDIRELLPLAIDIRLATAAADGRGEVTSRRGRPPHELFHAYLDEQRIRDERLLAMFRELHDAELELAGNER